MQVDSPVPATRALIEEIEQEGYNIAGDCIILASDAYANRLSPLPWVIECTHCVRVIETALSLLASVWSEGGTEAICKAMDSGWQRANTASDALGFTAEQIFNSRQEAALACQSIGAKMREIAG